jgi:hypothetical protein
MSAPVFLDRKCGPRRLYLEHDFKRDLRGPPVIIQGPTDGHVHKH